MIRVSLSTWTYRQPSRTNDSSRSLGGVNRATSDDALSIKTPPARSDELLSMAAWPLLLGGPLLAGVPPATASPPEPAPTLCPPTRFTARMDDSTASTRRTHDFLWSFQASVGRSGEGDSSTTATDGEARSCGAGRVFNKPDSRRRPELCTRRTVQRARTIQLCKSSAVRVHKIRIRTHATSTHACIRADTLTDRHTRTCKNSFCATWLLLTRFTMMCRQSLIMTPPSTTPS